MTSAPLEARAATTSFSAQRQVRVFVRTALLLVLGIVTLNFCINPLGYYPTHFVRPLKWSSRARKTAAMKHFAPPDVLILGSSRAMTFAPRYVRELVGRDAFNAGVDSAQAEDYYVLLRYVLEECGWNPRELIIGVDVEAFHDHQEPDARLLSDSVLRKYLTPSMRMHGFVAQAKALLSLDQLMQSGRSLRYRLRGYPAERTALAEDGTLTYPERDQRIAQGTYPLADELAASLVDYEARFAGYSQPSSERLSYFRRTLELAAAHHMRVHLYLTTLHPAVLDRLRRDRGFDQLHDRVAAELAAAATAPNVSFVDFTDVRAFDGNPDAFYDGAHLQPANASRLARALLTRGDQHALQ